MKVGILTYHSSHNYGAFLQAYSLAKFLNEDLGICAEIIDYSLKKAEEVNKNLVVFSYRDIRRWWILKKRFEVFTSSRELIPYLSKDRLISDDIDEFRGFIENQNYDAVITGSDEIWKLDGYRGFPNAYWLPNVKNVKKIAFAPSSRTEASKINDSIRSSVREFLADYSYIGVRDNVTKTLLDEITDSRFDIQINCDPTFLVKYDIAKIEAKSQIEKNYKINSKKKTIALMCGIPELANEVIRKYGKQYNIICLYEYYKGACRCIRIPDPFEWMKIIAGCDALITTFYHGLVFSIKNKTPFLAIENREMDDPSFSKSYDLLKRNKSDQHFWLFKAGQMEECLNKIEFFLESIDDNTYCAEYEFIMDSERKLAKSFESYLYSNLK